ncbi:DUF6624 domain-containing protein [Chryseosolibacter indicus]|uniref:Uncharacterized protein n=1 Tax=Chryseosolibacter indicus TaxID=2782351 RepID=A0ABS5VS69_9BACT|nr:DUF6624 domain-containing protein [Chryseosolibacter indicus]MBT1702856.1 hypothetical protein [Chryseosolibacter indicus]
MEYNTIAERIISMRDADLKLRDQLIQNGKLGEGYNEEMEKLHNQNAKGLEEIIDEIGYPTIDKVGKEASEAAWLIIQHSISQPNFMRKCAELLANAVSENKVDPRNLAYLTDRIAVLEGKPQSYGTQFDWDANGELNPKPFDNLQKVNERRKAIGLNTLEEQTEIMRRQVKAENQLPPQDVEERKHKVDQWRKAVGWIR